MTERVLDPEVARRVSGLRLRARKAVEGLLAGNHRSPRRGASVVFVEHREYRPGDDPRLLDWRAFARTDRHSIKHFEQETQLRATLVLDRSGSMAYPDIGHGPSKATHAATLLASLAYVLVRQGDAAGLITVDSDLADVLPARARAAHLDTLLRALSEPVQPGRVTDLVTALDAVAERAGRRGVVAVASDLLDLRDDALRPLASMVTRGNEVIVFHVLHPDEIEFPFHGPTRFTGLEGEVPLDVDPDAVRAAYQREVQAFLAACRSQCQAAGARYILARTDESPEHTLAALLATGRRGGWG
jgi:uncharacterized protein (DUF58 family)